MTVDEFMHHVASHDTPPSDMAQPLQALWQAAKGNWDAAHALAQQMKSLTGSWIHGHLHREEGDLDNAGFWYRHAGKPMPTESVQAERKALIHHFLRDDIH